MSDREAASTPSATLAVFPDYILGFESCEWSYYLPRTDDLDADFGPIGYPHEYDREPVWMRRIPASLLDEAYGFDGETVTRGKGGKFEPVYVWIECSEERPDAVACWAVRYAR